MSSQGDALTSLKQQLAQLSNLVNQRLIGNDPSTNYQQPVYVGGSIAGWFQLTNNGVNTVINNNTTSVDGNSVAVGLTVANSTYTEEAVVSPLNFALNTGIHGTPANLFVYNYAGSDWAGILTLVAADGVHNAFITLDAGALPPTITVGAGRSTDVVTTITPQGITTPSITIGSTTLTLPLPTTEGGTGSSYANFAALVAAIQAAFSPLSTTQGGTGTNYANFAALASAILATASSFALNVGVHGTPADLSVYNYAGSNWAGILTLVAADGVHNASITLDAGALPPTITVSAGPPTGTKTTITPSEIDTPSIVINGTPLTLPLPTTEGGTGYNLANFATLAANVQANFTGLSATVPLGPLTPTGSPGSITFSNGIAISAVDPS